MSALELESLDALLQRRQELARRHTAELETKFPETRLTKTSGHGSLVPFSWRTTTADAEPDAQAAPTGSADPAPAAPTDAAIEQCPPAPTMSTADLVEHVRHSILSARKGVSKLLTKHGQGVLGLDGMSNNNVRHLLNNICAAQGTRYMEIGVYKGSTLTSCLAGNEDEVDTAVGIDLWGDYASVMATGSRGNGNSVLREVHANLASSLAVTPENSLELALLQVRPHRQYEWIGMARGSRWPPTQGRRLPRTTTSSTMMRPAAINSAIAIVTIDPATVLASRVPANPPLNTPPRAG